MSEDYLQELQLIRNDSLTILNHKEEGIHMGFPLLYLSFHRTREHSFHNLLLEYEIDDDRRYHRHRKRRYRYELECISYSILRSLLLQVVPLDLEIWYEGIQLGRCSLWND